MAARVGWALIRRHQQELVLGLAALAVAVFALLPLAAPLLELGGGVTKLAPLAGSTRLWSLLLRSLILAASVTAFALALGVPLGILSSRTDVWGRRVLWLLHGFPLFLPPFLLALGWFHIAGRQAALGSEASATLLFSSTGAVMVLGLAFTPVVSALTALGILGVDASLEEAARTMATPWRVVTRILLPAALPAVILGAIIVFALALSELGVPMFLGVDVYPAAVFARIGGVDYAPGEAFGLALPLLIVALALAMAERRAVGSKALATLGWRGSQRKPMPLGKWRFAASAACWLVAAASVAPILALTTMGVAAGGFANLRTDPCPNSMLSAWSLPTWPQPSPSIGCSGSTSPRERKPRATSRSKW